MRPNHGGLLVFAFVVWGFIPQTAEATHFPPIQKIPVSCLYLDIVYPRDPASGQPLGATASQVQKLMIAHPPEAIRHRHPRLLMVLPGSFHHPKTLWPAGLLVIKRLGIAQPPTRTYPDRPAIGQTTTGKLLMTTNHRAWLKRNELRIALEAGPFLIVHGRDWPLGGFSDDPHFYRPTARRLIGLTSDGQLVAASLSGTLSEVRHQLRTSVPRLSMLMNLDGGSSTRPNQPIPNHLVIYAVDASNEPPIPTPIPLPSPESYLLNLLQ